MIRALDFLIYYCGWWAAVAMAGVLVSLPGLLVGLVVGYHWNRKRDLRRAFRDGMKEQLKWSINFLS
jgi:hypothetical protein